MNFHTKLALERWAKCYGVTQREALSLMVDQAQRLALDQAAAIPNGQADYYDGKLFLKLDSVTR